MHVSFIIACLSIRYINYTKFFIFISQLFTISARISWLVAERFLMTLHLQISLWSFFCRNTFLRFVNFSLHKFSNKFSRITYIIIYVANSSWKVQTTVRITWHAKWLTICYDRYAVDAEPTMRSLRIRPASRITFNARLMSTRP